ncbi:transporter, partial [Pseudomonas sp. HMSC75E02]|uniref:efflux transporter outer membrane subunit n=2 Tax=Pseudomonas TaxID=286 RepID=UPI0008A838F9
RIQRAELFPAVSASAEDTRQRALSDGTTAVSSQYSVGLGVSSYELDLFGRLRNLKDAALEDYLALEQTRRSTQISLVAEVASAWMTLAADQQLLKLARDTHASQQKTYELVQRSHGLGGESGLSLAQARSTVESARAEAASYASQVEQDRNALELLVGERLDASLLPGDTGLDAALLVTVPAGLPSSLLQRRPDVLAAEHTLKAANADIGAARAAFFPSVSLTASGGSASGELSGLFKSGSRAWSFAPSISLPIFDAGSNQAGLDAAKITRDIDVANYEKALQTAFSEVADALSVRSHINERLDAQRELTAATDKSYDLSLALYKQGSDSFLEVLDAQRSLYSAQQTLISLELAEQVNRVTLYKVLGGGWQG